VVRIAGSMVVWNASRVSPTGASRPSSAPPGLVRPARPPGHAGGQTGPRPRRAPDRPCRRVRSAQSGRAAPRRSGGRSRGPSGAGRCARPGRTPPDTTRARTPPAHAPGRAAPPASRDRADGPHARGERARARTRRS
jgi:hypothetical protein